MGVDAAKTAIGKEKDQELLAKRELERKLIEEREKEAELKIRSGKKLTTRDLIRMQVTRKI